MQNLRTQDTNTASFGMNKDLDPQALKDGMYINAINARLNTSEGGLSFINNEPSNFKCLNVTYTVIGTIKLPSGKFAVFSTNDFVSEIGVFDETTCEYEVVVKSTCLGFKKDALIKGVAKENFDCTESVYFTDGLNPRRHLNLSSVPYKYTILNDSCKTKSYTDELDCDELLIDKHISYPKISTEFGSDGQLKNGSYQVAIAYSVNGQVATDWLGTTFPIKTFEHDKTGKSIEVSIDNLDRDFDEYVLAVIYTVDGSTAVDRVGVYSTAQTKVVVSNVGRTAVNNSLLTIDEIVNKKPVYSKAEDLVATSQYLLWTNPTTKDELNYQQKAMEIVPKWVAYKVPKDYYRKNGGLVGYMRDEVYAFAIQWLYKTGDWSPAYHIPGRLPSGIENRQVGGGDVYEQTGGACNEDELPYFFQVYNTARVTKRYAEPNSDFCDPSIIAEGDMAYWQSSELYPDNEILYGQYKCTNIRHSKFPDSSVIHVHDNDLGHDNGAIILGVKFENISVPEDSTIVGYRIVRADRTGNRSIIAKGLLFNTGNYEDNGQACMYPNYPYNDLRTDPFLSKTQTKFNGNESNYQELRDFNNDKFTFHSPSTSFNKPILGSELKLEVEEYARVKGKFEEVHKHPKYKFITNFSFGIASAIAAGGAIIAIKGRKCVTSGTMPGGPTGAPMPFSYSVECETELVGKTGVPGATIPLPNIVGVTIAFGYYFGLGLQTVLNVIKLLSSWQQFAYQYNSHGLYSGYSYVEKGNKRRRINYSQYLIPGSQEINGVRMNNFMRESSVYLELNQGIRNPRKADKSRNTISGFGLCNDINQTVTSDASSYYATIKKKVANQYGQLNSISYLDTGGFYSIDGDVLESPHIFGGDTYIARFTEKRKMPYFYLWPFDVPDGYEWDYRKYYNIPYPRFWIDGTEYDFGEMAKLKLPSSKHNLDCYRASKGLFIVKDRYFYLANNGVIDYYAECEFNPAFRDWEDQEQYKHYDWRTNTNLRELFRIDRLQYDNKFLFDNVYLKQLTENFIPKQSDTFDPESQCNTKYLNRVIYSLPAQKEIIRDNWLIYPGLNYYDFMKDEGHLTAIRTFDRDRLVFLFDRSSPYVTLGVDTLQTDQGVKVLLGDGGVFAQRPQRLLYTDYGYGACESKHSWVSSQFGAFFPSQQQGRVFIFNGSGLDDISRNGMYWWFKENLPSKILKAFPNFKHSDNPVTGVGLISVFDNTNEVFYLSKKDYEVKKEWIEVTEYDEQTDTWRVRGTKVNFADPLIFNDASWTISYDPKTKMWVSFHDWHPDLTLQTENHFITIKDNQFWKHNDLCDSYCKFYDTEYPWEVEIPHNSGQVTSILSSIEYNLECYEYKDNCIDKFHLLDFNFDEMIVSNTEQISGLLRLNPKPKRTMISPYPIFDANHVKVEYSKQEQKYRINQFFDLTKDRGEFSGARKELFITQPNGYRKVPNPVAIDYGKENRKKFRHNYGSVILRRAVSDNISMRLKFINDKKVISPR